MPKRAPLDKELFKVELPPQQRDPLETLIPTAPIPPIPNKPTIAEEKRPRGQKAERSGGRVTTSPIGRSASRPEGQKPKREIKRHGFDVYRDQIVGLNTVQFEIYRRQGKKPSIGELVRPALDELIAKRKKELGL